MTTLRLIFTVTAIAVASHWNTVDAQTRTSRPLRLQQLEPSFHVSPIIHRLESARGKLVPFEFEIESVKRSTSIIVRAVALRQDENGTMVPATELPVPENLKVLSPGQMDLADDEQNTIRAQVRVPFSDSKFHSYGILVTDLGRIVGTAPVDNQPEAARRVGVRFVTRYLLRCDISVRNVRGADITRVEMPSAELIEVEGKAKARLWVSNPTDSPFEFQIRCRLSRPGYGPRPKPFNVCMPIRETLEPPERSTIRILAESRIRVEEYLPQAVFPGEYELNVEFISNKRTRMRKTFPLTIKSGDFPGQDARIVRVASDIAVSPSHLELSFRRKGNRFVPLEISNYSQQTIQVHLTPEATDGNESDWLVTRPATTTLRPGSKRKILVMVAPGTSIESHRYGAVRIEAIPEEGTALGSIRVPVALLSRSDQVPDLALDAIRWEDGEFPAFVAAVKNTGEMHIPLEGTLSLTDEFGRNLKIESGFGRWSLPGTEDVLRFRPTTVPPPGDYLYRLQVNSPLESGPYQLEGIVTVPEGEEAEQTTDEPKEA